MALKRWQWLFLWEEVDFEVITLCSSEFSFK